MEERVVDSLLKTALGDDQRESSVCFELKHSSAVTQFSRLLARRRGLPPELCAAGGLVHDIYVIVAGSYHDHAARGVPLARAMAEETGGFNEAELRDLESIVRHHSDKHLYSEDPFAEFGKDADVLDAFLYPGAFDWYLANKPLSTFQHYLNRAAKVADELGLPPSPSYRLLSEYSDGWLDTSIAIEGAKPAAPPTPDLPPFLIMAIDGWQVFFPFPEPERRSRHRLETSVAAAASGLLAKIEPDRGTAVMAWPAIERFELLDRAEPGNNRRLKELLPDIPDAGQTPDLEEWRSSK